MLVADYRRVQGDYTKAASLVRGHLERRVRRRGLVGVEVTHRVKTPLSLAKKLLRKPDYRSLADVPDLAGVRLTVTTLDDRDHADEMIQDLFPTCGREDKAPPSPDSFGYLGIHYDVRLGDIRMSRVPPTLAACRCEVQLHTRVQTAWALITHDSVYKPDVAVTPAQRRHFARLVALLEIFDLEARQGLLEMRSTPDFAASRLVEQLQSLFVSLTDGVGDPALSVYLTPLLLEALYDPSDISGLADRLATMAAANAGYLGAKLLRYASDDRLPLLSQPEVLLLWERLDTDKYQTMHRWPVAVDASLLFESARALGVALPEE